MKSERDVSVGGGFILDWPNSTRSTEYSIITISKKGNFFDSILTGDEKWIAFDSTLP